MNDGGQAYESENAVLSIIIENPELAFDVTTLKTDMFSSIAHKQLFDHIMRLATNGNRPDRQMIENQIKAYPELSSQSDFNFLQYILSQHYSIENLSEYTKIVADAYKSREVIKLASSLKQSVKTNPEIDTVIEDIKQKLEIISSVSGGENTSHLSDLVAGAAKELEYRIEHPNEIAWTTGFENFDLLTGGYKPRRVTIIAARPSVGKTAWICNSILKSAFDGIRSLVFEHEMGKQELVDRFLAIYCKVPLINITTGNVSSVQLNKMYEALETFKSLPIFLDTNFGSDINYLRATTRKYVKTHGINLVFIDYLQLMVERNDNMTMVLGNVSRELKVLATKMDIHVIAVSQLNRNVEGREDKQPTLSDLRQSGNLEEDADLVAMLFRPDMYRENKTDAKNVLLDFNIKKNRHGPVGHLKMNIDLETNTINGDLK